MPRESAAARVRGPYAKSARIQAEVIEKAIEAFAERGFTGTSMREIAIAVGMTQQGLSHHFPSKESLLEAVLQHRDEESVGHYRAKNLGVMDTLRAVVADNVHRPGLVQLSTMLSAEAISPKHPAHQFFAEHFAAAREIFTMLITRGQRSGEVRDDLPADELATLVVSIYEGLELQWLISSEIDMVSAFETAIRVLEPVQPARTTDKG